MWDIICKLAGLLLLGIGAIEDYREMKIPSVLLILLYLFGAIHLLSDFSLIYFGFAILPGVMLITLSFITGEKIGYGDGLVIIGLGMLLGIETCCFVLLLGMFFLAIVVMLLLLLRKVTLKDRIPYMPFLLLAYVVGLWGL